jgi:glutaredoxin
VIVTLYSRPDCHLCDEAREQLAEFDDIELRELDIDADEELLSAYLERIPVVEIDGRIVSELVFDRDAFTEALHTVQPWGNER